MEPPSSSSSQMTCVLKLDTQKSGWDKSMHKLIKGIRDVTYRIDATRGLAYISGKINPDFILRIRKAKKHAQLIHMDYGHVNAPPPLPSPPNSQYVIYSPPPQLPIRDGITGETQCHIL